MKRNGKGMRKGMAFAAAMALCLLCCACQPIPERAAIVPGGGIEERIEESAVSLTEYAVPASWQETLETKGGGNAIEIDATITVPRAQAAPVYLAKSKAMDAAMAEQMALHFAGGREALRDREPTKTEIAQELILARQKQDEEAIAEWEQMLREAPETAADETITDWNPMESPAGYFVQGDGTYSKIQVDRQGIAYRRGILFAKGIFELEGMPPPGEIGISEAEAEAAAQALLHSFGIDYMVADRFEKGQLCALTSPNIGLKCTEEPTSKGYWIIFTRNIEGIPALADKGCMFYDGQTFDYKAPFHPEEAQVYVNEAGEVEYFSFSNPLEIGEKLAENAKLLPFAQIQQRIRDMLVYIHSFWQEISIDVTDVELKMTIVNMRDRADMAMYVPAWFIYYTENSEGYSQECTLALNAIDGGRVLEVPAEVEPEM